MNKADILNLIKDAEERAEKMKKAALEKKEKNLAKARSDAQLKIGDGRARSKSLYDKMIHNSNEEILKEKQILLAKSDKKIGELKAKADTSISQATTFLIQEFERKANGA